VCQCPRIIVHRPVGDNIKDQVILLAISGKIRTGVIDHFVGANASHKLQLIRAVNGSYMCTKHFSQLYGEGSNTTSGTIHQHLVPLDVWFADPICLAKP
jgi:ABC-type cobalamin transport system ATPase subunit